MYNPIESKVRRAALRKGYRSGLEDKTVDDLKGRRIKFEYEKLKIEYWKPASKHTYTPDFVLLDSGIIVETKGYFTAADRKKHLLVREQHPDLDIRFVFSNSKSKLSKKSKTTYGDWCDKNGFIYADKVIPKEWE
jgi:hypothetical protein